MALVVDSAEAVAPDGVVGGIDDAVLVEIARMPKSAYTLLRRPRICKHFSELCRLSRPDLHESPSVGRQGQSRTAMGRGWHLGPDVVRLYGVSFAWRPNLLDESDNKFVEAAIHARATIVTYNERDYLRVLKYMEKPRPGVEPSPEELRRLVGEQ